MFLGDRHTRHQGKAESFRALVKSWESVFLGYNQTSADHPSRCPVQSIFVHMECEAKAACDILDGSNSGHKDIWHRYRLDERNPAALSLHGDISQAFGFSSRRWELFVGKLKPASDVSRPKGFGFGNGYRSVNATAPGAAK